MLNLRKFLFSNCILFLCLSLSYAEAPLLISSTVYEGPTSGGTYLKLLGDHFTRDTQVFIDKDELDRVRYVSSQTLIVTTKAHKHGAAKIYVKNEDGESTLKKPFIFKNAPPTILSISPQKGSDEGFTFVTVKGEYLTPKTEILFGKKKAKLKKFYHSGRISVITPAQSANTVEVRASKGKHSKEKITFTYESLAPIITRVTPAQVMIQGNQKIRIIGKYFRPSDQWEIGGVPVKIQNKDSFNSKRVYLIAPPMAEGKYDIKVISKGSSVILENGIEYFAPIPTISTLVPNKGTIDGGTSVHIFGNYFTKETKVFFNDSPIEKVTVRNSKKLTIKTPPGQNGKLVDLKIESLNGINILYGAFLYKKESPTLHSLAPIRGYINGKTRVSIRGRNFPEQAATVFFNGIEQTVLKQSSNRILVLTKSASSPGAVDVTIQFPETSLIKEKAFSYHTDAPILTGVNPISGPPEGGKVVHIYGRNFSNDSEIFWHDKALPIKKFISSRHITVVSPELQSKGKRDSSVNIFIKNEYGKDILYNAYQYQLPEKKPLQITYIHPRKGSFMGGTHVIFKGANLTGEEEVYFDHKKAEIIRRTEKYIKVKTPAVSDKKMKGVEKIVSIDIKSKKNKLKFDKAFTYIKKEPIIANLYPHKGFTSGGTKVKLKGTFFHTDAKVYFGPNEAKIIKRTDDRHLIVLSPPHAEGFVDIAIKTSLGKHVLPRFFEYLPMKPIARKVTPNHGPTDGGNKVRLHGKHFDENTVVSVDGIIVDIQKIHNSNSLTFVVPKSATKYTRTVDIEIQNSIGSFTFEKSYIYEGILDRDPPTISFSQTPNTYINVIIGQIVDSIGPINPNSVTASIDGISQTVILNLPSFSISLPSNLNTGAHLLSMSAKDEAGNLATTELTFLVDQESPSISFNPVIDQSNSSSPILTGNISDIHSGIDANSFSVSMNGQTVDSTNTSDSFTVNLNNLSDGNHNLTIKVKDVVGNEANLAHSILIDTTAPQIDVTQPSANSVSNNTNITVQGSIADNSPIQSYTVKLNGSIIPAPPLNNNDFQVNLPTLSEGAQLVNITAEDTLQNTNSIGLSLFIDTTPPSLSFNNPDTPDTIFTTTTPTLAISYSDNHEVDMSSLNIQINSVAYTGDYNVTDSLISFIPTLEPNTYQIQASLKDQAGNETIVNTTFIVEPQIIIVEEVLSDDHNLQTVAENVNPKDVRILDANNDGKLDIVYKEINDNKIKVIHQQ